MSEDKGDLLRLASEYADKNLDLYDLLGVDALTSKVDIHRAWRKRSLKYHPDKAGASFDAEKWELFERARDVLSDPSARSAYDVASKAKLLRKQEREAMNKERQKFADDLEGREAAAKESRLDKEQKERQAMQMERERLAEAHRLREEEQKRQVRALQEVEDLAEASRRLKKKKEDKARKKQAKSSLKATGHGGLSTGPANGVVAVPGAYLVGEGDSRQRYWELVCDKLRAVQAVKDLLSSRNLLQPEAVAAAERELQDVRKRIQTAEAQYQSETTAS